MVCELYFNKSYLKGQFFLKNYDFRAVGIAQWQSAYLAFSGPWVPNLAPRKEKS